MAHSPASSTVRWIQALPSATSRSASMPTAHGHLPAAMRNLLVRLGWPWPTRNLPTEAMLAALPTLPRADGRPARFDCRPISKASMTLPTPITNAAGRRSHRSRRLPHLLANGRPAAASSLQHFKAQVAGGHAGTQRAREKPGELISSARFPLRRPSRSAIDDRPGPASIPSLRLLAS